MLIFLGYHPYADIEKLKMNNDDNSDNDRDDINDNDKLSLQ